LAAQLAALRFASLRNAAVDSFLSGASFLVEVGREQADDIALA
jgi:hypothetical protein